MTCPDCPTCHIKMEVSYKTKVHAPRAWFCPKCKLTEINLCKYPECRCPGEMKDGQCIIGLRRVK